MQRFLSRFDERLIELTRLAHASDADALALAFHSLAGIGGTYGFPEITIVARAAEEGRRDAWSAIGELERIRSLALRDGGACAHDAAAIDDEHLRVHVKLH